MSDFTIDIELHASPAAVFNYLADGSRTPEWYEAVQAGSPPRFSLRLPGSFSREEWLRTSKALKARLDS